MVRFCKFIFLAAILMLFQGCKLNDSIESNIIEELPPTPPESISISYSGSAEVTKGALFSLAPMVEGSFVGFTIDKSLPAGLVFNTDTGEISGNPTEESPLTTYVISVNYADGRNADVSFSFYIPLELTTNNQFGSLPDINPGDGICIDGAGSCTFLAAVQEANAKAPIPAKITLAAGTYSLGGTEIEFLTDTTITGQNRDVTIFDGQNLSRVFKAGDNIKLTLSDFTITNGKTSNFNEAGAAILMGSGSALILTNCKFTNNEASLEDGGAIYSEGEVSIDNCIFDNNSNPGGISYGGAIAIYRGLTFPPNKLTVKNSEFTNNLTGWDGGAIFSEVDVIVEDCIFDSNSGRDAGAIFLEGSLTVKHSQFLNNTSVFEGGAILIDGWSDNFNLIENSYFFNNQATYRGGAVSFDFFSGDFLIKNSTFLDNFVSHATDGDGGSINLDGATSFNNNRRIEGVTISGSSASRNGASIKVGLNSVKIANTIINDGVGTNNCYWDVGNGASIESLGYNIDSGNSCGLSAQGQLGDLENTDPQLDVAGAQFNGDTVPNILLLPASPALDVIPLAACNAELDQRGLARPQGGLCDIGATEQ